MRVTLIQLLLICLLSTQLAAQEVPGLTVGAKVRVWTTDIRKMSGRVEALTKDSIVLQPEGRASISIPVAVLTRVEISRGFLSRKESAWKYAKWGAVIGAVPGAISLGLQHEEVGGGSSVAKATALGAWSGALFGGLIGAAIGAGRQGEKWERLR